MFELDIYQIFAEMQKDPEAMRLLLDNMNSQYNNAFWKQLSDIQPMSKSKRFGAIIDESHIAVKASLLSAYGKKPLRSFEGYEKYWESMHKIGHGFELNQEDINNIEELNLVDPKNGIRLMDTYRNRGTAIVQGFHATWNGWIYNALSKYQITLNNQGVVEAEVDMRVPSSNKLAALDAGSKGWFDPAFKGSKAEDLERMTEVADEQNMPASRVFYISKKLAKKLVKDEALRKIIVASAGYVNLDFVQVSRKRFLSLLSDVLEIPPFVVIDEKSRTEKNGIPMVDPKDFDENKIILAPAGKLFNAYPSLPDYAKDSNPATVKGSTENGIIGSLTRYESEPFAMITNMEAWLFPVFKNPKWLVGLDTSKGTTDGLDK